jgi:hypothetical protein
MLRVVKVELWALMSGAIREVKLPDMPDDASVEDILDATWHWGQNDFQAVKDRCSVSMGDVVLLDNERYIVAMMGFHKMSDDEYQRYIKLSPQGRAMGVLSVMGDDISAEQEDQ